MTHPVNTLVFSKTETPCIGICSTIYGDQICRGCLRNFQEVIDWNTYPDSKKTSILIALENQIVNVMQDKFEIINAELLKQKCNQFQVKIRIDQNPLTWAHALVRDGINRIRDVEKYGIKIKPAYATLRLPKLIELIDDEIFAAAHHSI